MPAYNGAFYKTLIGLSIPIIVQDFLMSTLNFADVLMIGQLGETSIAALGLSNQIYFLFFMSVCGIANGAAVFTAQYWGKRDIINIRKVLGICLGLTIIISLGFTFLALFLPEKILSIYSNDPQVILIGSRYLRIAGFSYLFTGITFAYCFILRSIGQVKLPMIASLLGVLINILLNYVLIFGKFGFPALGVAGAAIATVIARVIELLTVLTITYIKKYAPAASLREMFSFSGAFLRNILSISIPVLIQTFVWAAGVTVYQIIYAHISTESIAAVNIVSSIERIGFIFFVGIAHAAGIMIGNGIGSNNEETAYHYGKRFIKIGMCGAVIMGIIFVLISEPVLSFYHLPYTGLEDSRGLIIVISILLWTKVSNVLLIMGIFRAGGDTRMGMILDTIGPWVFGIPAAFISAFVFHLPVTFVVLFAGLEEIFKLSIGYPRFFSKKWIHNLVREN